MDPLETDTPVAVGALAVPGATLHYEVRGTGPLLLLLCGGNSDAAVFDRLAAVLAVDHRVVTVDPRGNSRSTLEGPPVDQRIEVHADDAYRLLERLSPGGGPVRVFGSCSGGLTALELARRHPERIAALVVHEPPAFGLLPDAAQRLAFIDGVYGTFCREGVGAAMAEFSVLFGGRAAPELPEAHDNTAFFLAHMLRPRPTSCLISPPWPRWRTASWWPGAATPVRRRCTARSRHWPSGSGGGSWSSPGGMSGTRSGRRSSRGCCGGRWRGCRSCRAVGERARRASGLGG